MPRPSVSIETVDSLNDYIDQYTTVPSNALDFEDKVGVVLNHLQRVHEANTTTK